MSNATEVEPSIFEDVLADIYSRLERLEGDRSGVWLAFHSDWSGIAVFATEIEALRHAQEHTMTVEFRQWGEIR